MELQYGVLSDSLVLMQYRTELCASFLGTGKYTPTAAVSGDMGWKPSYVSQWKSICTHWHRHVCMVTSRLNKRIFKWAYNKANRSCKNWFHVITDTLKSIGHERYIDISVAFPKHTFVNDISTSLLATHVNEWTMSINRTNAAHGIGRNKLRTYRLF